MDIPAPAAAGAPPSGADTRSVAELTELAARGARVKYLSFWGHRPRRDGSIGPGCLSQWWPSADDERADRPDAWRGLNLLGFALMEARARLAGGAHPA